MISCFYCKREHDPTKYCQPIADKVLAQGNRPNFEKFLALTAPKKLSST